MKLKRENVHQSAYTIYLKKNTENAMFFTRHMKNIALLNKTLTLDRQEIFPKLYENNFKMNFCFTLFSLII